MSDSYQAVYDATRSRIGSCSTREAIESAVRQAFDGVHHSAQLFFQQLGIDYAAPHVLLRPVLRLDGNKWCALYGEDIQSGLSGWGDSPHEAMIDFNRAYYARWREKA